MISFTDKIGVVSCGEQLGYSEEEVTKIEKLYDIKIEGFLKDFLTTIGRSSGGALGDELIILYSEAMSVRGHILFQNGIKEDIYSAGYHKIMQEKPFIFSIQSETQYYFLQTASDEPDRVYHYDENNETVEKTEWTLVEYLKMLVEWRAKNPPKFDVICRGELLVV